MLCQQKWSMKVKAADENGTEDERVACQRSCSQLSQIYLEEYEKKKKLERKVKMEPQNEPLGKKKSQDNVCVNTEKKLKSLIGDSSDVPFKKAACSKQLKFRKKEKNNNRDLSENLSIEELIAKNKELKNNLEHSRKRCRELLIELREEREGKKIKIEDFNMIRTLLNRYI